MDERDRANSPDDPANQATAVEIADVLDLHTFRPRDVPDLVRHYIDECLASGLIEVRIIHGKGIGNLRRTVHAILERHEGVEEYVLAGESAGGWGATIARLRPR